MKDGKIIICPNCGIAIVEVQNEEPCIRGRIYKFDKTNGNPFVICKGSIANQKPCKAIVSIPKKLILKMMMEELVPA